MRRVNKARSVAVNRDAVDVTKAKAYKDYKQSRLAKCVRIAREAKLTYGEAERRGLFNNI